MAPRPSCQRAVARGSDAAVRGVSLPQVARTLLAQRTRTLLTLLGIVIASGSLVLLVALIEGGERALLRASQEAVESDLLEVRASPPPEKDRQRTQRPLSRYDATALAASAAFADAWVGSEQSYTAFARAGERRLQITVVSSTPQARPLYRLELQSGRFLQAIDDREARRTCVIGYQIWRDLFERRDPLGASIEVDGDVFRVVGVLRSKPTLGGNIGPRVWNRKVMLAESTFDLVHNPQRTVDRIFVRARSEAAPRLELLEGLTRGLLLRRHFGVMNFSMPAAEGKEQAELIFQIAELLLLSTALVSLMVGGINVMNVMLVTVSERRREIGIRRAVGASPAAIRTQFLLESALLTGLGGVVGTFGGALACVASTWLLRLVFGHWDLCIEAWAIAAGVGSSVLTGLGFGAYPAARAARVDVIDALRSE